MTPMGMSQPRRRFINLLYADLHVGDSKGRADVGIRMTTLLGRRNGHRPASPSR